MVTLSQNVDNQPIGHRWVLLAYDIPRQPSAPRVQIWRRLKRLGAELLHGAVWVLPSSARSREEFQWLAAEVIEAGGHATTWLASTLLGQQESALREAFALRTRASYGEIQDALATQSVPLTTLIQHYRQVRRQDYFGDPLGDRVAEALRAARRELASCNG